MKNFIKRAVDATLVQISYYLATRILAHPAFEYQAAIRREIFDLKKLIAEQTPGNPCLYGFKVYSQCDEDGIIEYILSKIPNPSKTFIEIGCGRGVENNTHYLLLKGYQGCWIDGSKANIDFIEKGLGGLRFSRLSALASTVTTENIADTVRYHMSVLGTAEPDFISIDIDGNDLPVLKNVLTQISPKVICVEYNPKFPPPLAIGIAYNSEHVWTGGDYHGASLQAFCDTLTGYRLISCNLSGANAFFVRNDCAEPFPSYAASALYQPFRDNLIGLKAEHTPSLRWLKDQIGQPLSHQ